MTIALVQSVNVASGTTTSFSVTKPAGTASGHMMLAFHSADTGTSTSQLTISGGSTWTEGAALYTNGGSGHTIFGKVWWKFAGGSEPASYTLGQASNSDGAVSMMTFSGVDPGANPIFATPAGFTTTNGNSVAIPSITPAGADDVEVRMVCGNASNTTRTWTYPSSTPAFTSLANVQSQTYPSMRVAYRQLASSSATGTVTATCSGIIYGRQGFTVSLKTGSAVPEFQGWGVPL